LKGGGGERDSIPDSTAAREWNNPSAKVSREGWPGDGEGPAGTQQSQVGEAVSAGQASETWIPGEIKKTTLQPTTTEPITTEQRRMNRAIIN